MLSAEAYHPSSALVIQIDRIFQGSERYIDSFPLNDGDDDRVHHAHDADHRPHETHAALTRDQR